MKRLLFLLVLGVVLVILAAGRPWRRLAELFTRARASVGRQDAPRSGTTPRLLFHLPLPVALAALVAMVRGQLLPLLGDTLGYGLFLAGALVVRRGLAEPARWPLKTLGAMLIAAATGVTVWLGVGRDPAVAAVFAVVALLACALTYGLDLAPALRRRPLPGAGSHTRATLAEAARSIAAIEEDISDIRQPELNARLRRILQLASNILERLEEDPRDLYRARTFLNVYLEGVQRVVEGYARTHQRVVAPELDERFRAALLTIEEVFHAQEQKLLETDLEDLDVQIEVLMRQLEEGRL